MKVQRRIETDHVLFLTDEEDGSTWIQLGDGHVLTRQEWLQWRTKIDQFYGGISDENIAEMNQGGSQP